MPWSTFMVVVYLVHEDSTLLIFHPEREEWEPPRGALHDHELPEEAAIRIVKEQLSADAQLIGARKVIGEHIHLTDPIAMLTEHADARHEHIQFVYAARISGPIHEDVHWIDAQWFSGEDLKNEEIPESVRVCAGLAAEAAKKESEKIGDL